MSLTHTTQALDACRFLGTVFPQFRWSQYRFLLTVAAHPGLTHAEVAKRLDVTPAAVTRAVDVFGSKGRKGRANGGVGFIAEHHDPDDDRNKFLSITPKGVGFLEQIEDHLYGKTR